MEQSERWHDRCYSSCVVPASIVVSGGRKESYVCRSAWTRFASEGQFETYDPYPAVMPQQTAMFTLQCRSCGFEPEDVVTFRACAPSAMRRAGNASPAPAASSKTPAGIDARDADVLFDTATESFDDSVAVFL